MSPSGPELMVLWPYLFFFKEKTIIKKVAKYTFLVGIFRKLGDSCCYCIQRAFNIYIKYISSNQDKSRTINNGHQHMNIKLFAYYIKELIKQEAMQWNFNIQHNIYISRINFEYHTLRMNLCGQKLHMKLWKKIPHTGVTESLDRCG